MRKILALALVAAFAPLGLAHAAPAPTPKMAMKGKMMDKKMPMKGKMSMGKKMPMKGKMMGKKTMPMRDPKTGRFMKKPMATPMAKMKK